MNWQLKALLPIAAVLLNGLLMFMLVTIGMSETQGRVVLVVAGAGAIVICAMLVVVLGVMIRQPMLELQDKIQRVSDGDLNVTVNFTDRNDEIGDLGRNFNSMVQQLRENREEIQRLHQTQMSRAEHLATLGELAAGLAHEIRNPLAGIAGVIDVIGRELPESSASREVLADVRQEISHINRIVSDLLETARPKPPEFRLADLNATAEHAVIFARQHALAQPVTIELVRADGLPQVDHDPRQIHQILLNLLLNAVQAIEGSGRVRVEIGARGDLAFVRVSDSGRGIAPENLANIFRPFFTTKGDGTGLGLPLAQRIVEDHGGTIEVSSRPGEGSEFTVLLPFRRAATAQESAAAANANS
jgi:hypothetical protein